MGGSKEELRVQDHLPRVPSNVCSQDSVLKVGDPTLKTGKKGILVAL